MKLFIDQLFTNTDVERFADTYFSEEFNNAVARHIGLKERRLVEEEPAGANKVRRRVRMVPAVELPKPVKKLIGDHEISYDEVSVYDAEKHEVDYHIESGAQDRVQVRGVIRFVPHKEGVRRVIDGEVEVKVFGLGGLIERLIESEVQKGYEKIGAFMQRWLDEHAA